MKIHLATDHAGFQHKEALKEYLATQGVDVIDHGAVSLDTNDDYPDFVLPAAQAVALDPESVGIVFGWSGQGEAMVSNRVPGIRASVYYGGPTETVILSREHNNSNILSIGAHFVPIDDMYEIINLWLQTAFTGEERHVRRISKF